jgi:hypothetical protein
LPYHVVVVLLEMSKMQIKIYMKLSNEGSHLFIK